MSEQAQRFPLSWPSGWRRTPPIRRRRARFTSHRQPITVADAFTRMLREIRLLGGADTLMSSNVPRGERGNPLSRGPEPADPGAAVYFKLKGQPRALACDTWTRVADNMVAIAYHIKAIRAIDRYGVGTIEQAFQGYAALPSGIKSWWDVLGVDPTTTLTEVEDAYRRLSKTAHPDTGGSHERMAELNAAREAARKAVA